MSVDLLLSRSESVVPVALEQAKAAALGRLSAAFAHELRNTLTAVRCYLELIGDNSASDPTGAFGTRVDADLDKIGRSTADWIEIARGDSASSDVTDELARVLAFLRSAGIERHIAVECSLPATVARTEVDGAILQAILLVEMEALTRLGPEALEIEAVVSEVGIQLTIAARLDDRSVDTSPWAWSAVAPGRPVEAPRVGHTFILATA